MTPIAIARRAYGISDWMDYTVYPVMRLVIRLFMANIFFLSGWLKFENYLNDNWDATLYLYTEEHPVPFLSPDVAAIIGTGGELVFSTLLALGLFGRLGALGLLIMTMVIQFTYQMNNEHILWALELSIILTGGPGKISVDEMIKRWIKP